MRKTILITGCSSGIGYHVAKGLDARGYRVFATARKMADVDMLNREGLESIQLDLNNSKSIKSAVNEILKRTDGHLDAVFNNGAYGQPGAVEDLSRDTLRQQFETNVFGWLELTNLIIPVMRKQRYGRIIKNSSVLGLVSLPFRGAYNSSKYAIEGLTDTLRLELKGTGIHVSLIEPGPIESDFRKNALAAFEQNIDAQKSVFRETYVHMIARLRKEGRAAPFTLPATAVFDKVVHALESDNPKPRYYVTFPTYLFGYLKRFISTRMQDKILLRISRNEHQ